MKDSSKPSKRLDKHDLNLLKTMTGKFSFPKSRGAASRAYDLQRDGLLDVEMGIYGLTGGGRRAQFRPAFRITDAGREALAKALRELTEDGAR